MAQDDQGLDLSALNYTILVPYNGTGMTGGDSLTEDLNIFYNVRERTRNADMPGCRRNTKGVL